MAGELPAKKAWSIQEVARETGLSPSVLRIWELRYGWPNPKRKGNGYREYSDILVRDLKRASVLHKAGRSPTSFIEGHMFIDGVLPHEKAPKAGKPDLRALERYVPPEMRQQGSWDVFAKLKRALLDDNFEPAVALLSAWQTVHPFDRYHALFMPGALWVVGIEPAEGYDGPLEAVWRALKAAAQTRYDDAIAEAKELFDAARTAAPLSAAVPARPKPATPPPAPAPVREPDVVDPPAVAESPSVPTPADAAVRGPVDGEQPTTPRAVDVRPDQCAVGDGGVPGAGVDGADGAQAAPPAAAGADAPGPRREEHLDVRDGDGVELGSAAPGGPAGVLEELREEQREAEGACEPARSEEEPAPVTGTRYKLEGEELKREPAPNGPPPPPPRRTPPPPPPVPARRGSTDVLPWPGARFVIEGGMLRWQ